MKHLGLFSFIIAFILSSCGNSRWLTEFELDENTFDSEAMEMIKADSGLTIPSDAKGLNFRYRPPIDPSFIARIEIPPGLRMSMVSQIETIQNERIDISLGLGERVD